MVKADNQTGLAGPCGGFHISGGRLLRLAVCLPFLLVAGCLSGGDSQSSDPVVVENAVAFVKRPLLYDENNGALIGDNLAEPAAFRPGARLFLKDRASPDAAARDISSRVFSGPGFLNDEGQLRYDVKDLNVSHDGTRLVFAMRAPEIEDADEDEQPTWNIWEYDLADDSLRRVIASSVTAEEGQDVAPAYLPDGRIVFASTRQRVSRAVLLDEGKPQYPALEEGRDVPAFVLHVMDDDGDNIDQITFNQSHDLDPLVTDDGTIVFSRWDNAGQTANNGFNLYRVNPDGTGLSYLYGRHSHDSVGGDVRVEYLRPQATDSGRILAQLRPASSDNFSAIPAEIDAANFVEAGIARDGSAGTGQIPLVSGLSLGEEISLRGNYSSVSPLLDGTRRYLVSWSPCRLQQADGEGDILNCTEDRIASGNYRAAPPVYGLWLLDMDSGTQRPIEPPAEGQQFDEAVLMKDRPLPMFIPESQYTGEEAALADAGLGVVHIRSVYDIDGVDTSPTGSIARTADPADYPAEDLPARFLRIEKPVSIPDDDIRDFDNSAFGRSQAQSMREILGYVPVEPDGSVRVAVPANVAFGISVVDDEGKRIGPRHQNWLSLRPGETVQCNGCHEPNSAVPHGRPDAGPASVNTGAATTGLEFPNTDPALFADMGETMAETWARINGTRRLGPDAVYVDQWTDESVVARAEAFTHAYGDLQTPAPISEVCAGEWSNACRAVINYEQHIHPLWGLDRQLLDNNGAVVDDYTCTGCHTNADANGAVRLPDAQLDLTDGPSTDNPDHFKAYRELLFPDNEQMVEGDFLVDVLVDTGEIQRDEDGEPILDADGNEQPILAPVPVSASMSVNGARFSDSFFEHFRESGTHEGFLSPAELRLIAEWLDIGGQYYNNPFDAPAD